MADTEQKKDFFISRNRADSDWGRWIAWQLEEAGYTTVLQDWDFRPSQNFVLKMHSAATNCERTIAVLSTAYFAAEFSASEWAARFVEDPTGEEGKLITVRVAECDPPGLLKAIIYIDLVGLDKASAKDALLEGVKRGRLKPSKAPGFPGGQAPRFPGALPPTWNVPHPRNRNFTGREQLLADLRNALTSEGTAAVTQAIHGLGGVGKTQLATEYCYRHGADYEIVWWVRSEKLAQLASDYAGLAAALALEEAKHLDERVLIDAVRRQLEHTGKWLVVFDNVNSPEDLDEYLPRVNSGHVLITSRHHSWRGYAASVPVHIWNRRESVDFLLRRTGRTDAPGASDVAGALGDLPLALAQAGAYIEDTRLPFVDYVALFKTSRRQVLKQGASFRGYELTVATTWSASFEKLEQENPAAADLLRLCAFLAPDDVPLDLIRRGTKHLPRRLTRIASDPVGLPDAMAALGRYSLIGEGGGEAVSVHRLVQTVIRDHLSTKETRRWAAIAATLMAAALDSPDKFASWPHSTRLLAHAVAAAEHAETAGVARESIRLLFNQRSQLRAVREAYEKALHRAEAFYPSDHPALTLYVNNVGRVLQALGDRQGARAAYERAVCLDEAAYGPQHPNVAIRVSNLGRLLQEMGDLSGSRVAYERALKIDEGAYGPDHLTVAIRVNNLGRVLQDEGDLAGAKAAYERALKINQRLLGDDHPSTLQVQSNLEALGK